MTDGLWVLRLRGGAVSFGAVGRRAVDARLSDADIAAWRASVRSAMGSGPPVAIPGRDAARVASEERTGRALASLLHLDPALAAAWGAACAGPITLLVDGEEDLPWELLSAGPAAPPIERHGLGSVVRLGEGRSADPSSADGMLLLCPTPDDPVCADRVDALRTLAEDRSIPLGSEGEPAGVAWVVCHGRQLDGLLELGPGRALAGLDVPAVALAVVQVCSSTPASLPPIDTLAGRWLQSGVPACVAAPAEVTGPAVDAFTAGLLDALQAGRSIAHAAAAGRDAVFGLADPRPEARPSRFQLHVASAEAATRSVLAGSRLTWPPCSSDTLALLQAAERLASSVEHGFVGVEHLLLALLDSGDRGPGVRRLRVRASAAATHLLTPIGSMHLKPDAPTGLRPTPRLLALVGAHPSLDALCSAVLHDPGHALAWLLPTSNVDGSATVAPTSTESPLADALEVVGGPEDGRVIPLVEGLVLGRASRSSRATGPGGLYADSALTDPALSRSALRVDGEIRIAKALSLGPPGARVPPDGSAWRPRVGDQLELTASTRVRACLRRGDA